MMPLRPQTYKRKDGHGDTVSIRCGDCHERLTVYQCGELVEIGNVIATRKEWRRVLGPLLREVKSAGKR